MLKQILLWLVAISLAGISTIMLVVQQRNPQYLPGVLTTLTEQLLPTGQCSSPYGKIAIFIAVKFDQDLSDAPLLYNVALSTVECYAKRAVYELLVVNLLDDNVTGNACDKYSMHVFHFRRHCHLRHYMTARPDIKWWLFMDADIMIVNPDRCIHEFIDPDVDITFYERFWNLEIMTGGILYKNSKISKQFLFNLAEYNFKLPSGPKLAWSGHDNGAVHLVVPEMVFSQGEKTLEIEECRKNWSKSESIEMYYYDYVWCLRALLGSDREWNKTFRILHRGHGWAMDLFIVGWTVSDPHFMTHGVKAANLTDQLVFASIPTGVQCEPYGADWSYIPGHRVNMTDMRLSIKSADDRVLNRLVDPANISEHFRYRIGDCWPECPMEYEHNLL